MARDLLAKWPSNCYSSNKEILNSGRSCWATPWYSFTYDPPNCMYIFTIIEEDKLAASELGFRKLTKYIYLGSSNPDWRGLGYLAYVGIDRAKNLIRP